MGKNAELSREKEKSATIESRLGYETKFLKVRRNTIKVSEEEIQDWDFVEHVGSVAILAIDNQNQLILVEQWRHPIQKITLELPAGLIDPHESAEEAAFRELQEEAGLKANFLSLLGGYYSSPGCLTEYVHIFLAKDLEPSRLYADDTSKIDLKVVTLSEALGLITNGTICDSTTALGVLKYLYA
jgi:ADP-ribose pyrophosphatase